ncbi:hypothetical protein DL96DRAFT_1822685 [Flagelloscypha sp. PMI_526]|nr:hypothetical protein DL96DRAFT_1822685 [Flagelloscypha sp. PMI_526]
MYGKLDLQGKPDTEGNILAASMLVTYTVDSGTHMKASYPIPSDPDKIFGEQSFFLKNLPSDQEHDFTMSLLGGGGSPPNVGAIARGVIGCVGFLALSILIFKLFRKRRRANSLPFDDIQRPTVQIAPFINISLNRSPVKEVYSPDSVHGRHGSEPPSYNASMGKVAGQPAWAREYCSRIDKTIMTDISPYTTYFRPIYIIICGLYSRCNFHSDLNY